MAPVTLVSALLEDEDDSLSVKSLVPDLFKNPNAQVCSLSQMKRTNPIFFSNSSCAATGTEKIWKKGNFLILKDVDCQGHPSFSIWLYHKRPDRDWRIRIIGRKPDFTRAVEMVDALKDKPLATIFPDYSDSP